MRPFLEWFSAALLIVGVGVGLTFAIVAASGEGWMFSKLWLAVAFGVIAVTYAALEGVKRR